MKKSNIVLAIIAGAAVGGIVAIILQAEKALLDEHENEEDNVAAFDKIAQQFSDKISSDLKTAETKIKSGVKSKGFVKPDEETGVFL